MIELGMNDCPFCQASGRVVKNGATPRGSQRYLCRACGQRWTPQPKVSGYPPELRRAAVQMYVDGMNLRRIARTLGVVHQTVANWVNAQADRLPAAPPQPERVETAELDELFTFVGAKKTPPTS